MVESLYVERDAESVREVFGDVPRVSIVAGSGLGGLADKVEDAVAIPYTTLPSYPKVGSVAGHAHRLVCGRLAGVPVAVFAGRVHAYQGATALEAAYPARLAASLGSEVLVVTNAAGGVSDKLNPGDIVVLSDQMNLTGSSPLIGWPGPQGGTPFVPMRDAFDPHLRELALEVGRQEAIPLVADGVYAGLLGPAYETQAEVTMLRTLGADVVGMSTVNEVIVARATGMRVLGVSLVTNVAAGTNLSHDEVLEAGRTAAGHLEQLMTGILRRL